ncbi:alpha/beta hydrolase [Rossellomorea arthrocnemi]
MKKILKWTTIVLLAVVLIGGLGFYFWSEQTYSATEELIKTIKIEEDPLIEEKKDWLIFNPEESNSKGLILYPGAKVEVEAYGYLGKSLSEKGYTVVIPRMPFHIAFLGIGESEKIINSFDEELNWYVSGHSLGGVAASTYAYDHQDEIKGVIFLASYPTNSTDFSESDVPFLSIYAENDGLTTEDDIEKSKKILPQSTVFHQIEGGNHAGFGMYGKQKGDLEAYISPRDQQDEIIRTMDEWLFKH